MGGGSKYIRQVDEFLTLDGLRMIWERNSGARTVEPAKAAPEKASKSRSR
jgi:hypothetical protein